MHVCAKFTPKKFFFARCLTNINNNKNTARASNREKNLKSVALAFAVVVAHCGCRSPRCLADFTDAAHMQTILLYI